MTTPDDLLRELMMRVRRSFFAGRPDKVWFSQQERVKQALTLPAKYLHERGVPLPIARYRAIFDDILTRAEKHGNLAALVYPSVYLLDVVQKHLQHHGDAYYEEGKSLRNSVDYVVAHVEHAHARRARAQAGDPTVAILAQVNAAIRVGRRQAKKPAAPALQTDLFAGAKAGKGRK